MADRLEADLRAARLPSAVIEELVEQSRQRMAAERPVQMQRIRSWLLRAGEPLH